MKINCINECDEKIYTCVIIQHYCAKACRMQVWKGCSFARRVRCQINSERIIPVRMRKEAYRDPFQGVSAVVILYNR